MTPPFALGRFAAVLAGLAIAAATGTGVRAGGQLAGVGAVSATAASATPMFTASGNGLEAAPPPDGALATEVGLAARSIAAMPNGGFLAFGERTREGPFAGNALYAVSWNGAIRAVRGGDAMWGELAVTTGGAIVAAQGTRVRRLNADGTVSTLAGTGERGLSGDGGPATRARLLAADEIAATADGGIVIGDGHRVRKIAARGVISTIASGGTERVSDRPRPATRVALRRVASVATSRTEVFFVESRRVRRVAADGTLTTIAGGGSLALTADTVASATSIRFTHPLGEVAALPDGSVLVNTLYDYTGQGPFDGTDGRIWRITADGTIRRFAANGGSTAEGIGNGVPNGDGGPAADAAVSGGGWYADLAATADGGVLIGELHGVRFVPGPRSRRLAIAIRQPLATGRRAGALYTVSHAATVRIDVLRDARVVARRTAVASAGRHAIAVAGALAPGQYGLRLLAVSAGRAASAHAIIQLGRRLDRRSAARALDLMHAHVDGPFSVRHCRRFAANRIDCTWGGEETCGEECYTEFNGCSAIVLSPVTGLRSVRTYFDDSDAVSACPLTSRPRWDGAAQIVTEDHWTAPPLLLGDVTTR